MDIYTVLHDEHLQLIALISRLRSSYDVPVADRAEFLDDLKSAVDEHTRSEVLYFYPLLAAQTATEIMNAVHDEHEQLDQLLSEVDDFAIGTPGWNERLEDLERAMLAYVDFEEQLIFPRVRDVLSSAEASRLGQTMRSFSEQERRLQLIRQISQHGSAAVP